MDVELEKATANINRVVKYKGIAVQKTTNEN